MVAMVELLLQETAEVVALEAGVTADWSSSASSSALAVRVPVLTSPAATVEMVARASGLEWPVAAPHQAHADVSSR
jgi:hypothetical protein